MNVSEVRDTWELHPVKIASHSHWFLIRSGKSINLAFILFLIGMLAMVGCAKARYSANSLPLQFAAKPQLNARYFDLSRMPRKSIPEDWLQPGDQVEVSVATGVERNNPSSWLLTVDDRGVLDVPLVGQVAVGGVAPTVAATRVRDASISRGLYINPKVNVTLTEKRKIRVVVTGAVSDPRTIELPASASDLAAALSAVGGVTEDAAPIIEIRHSLSAIESLANASPTLDQNGVVLASYGGQQIPQMLKVDLANIQAYPPESLQLFDGSVVSVVRTPRRTVSVSGLVKRPDQIEMPPQDDLTLLDAIARAGGTSVSIADRVLLIRRVPEKTEPIVIKASLREARSGGPDNLILAAGDIVNVEETPATVALQAVTTFFRVGFTAAMPGF